MNKKFLSAILFGALMVSSTGTFVSCKDYDDDIEDLQEQINKLATKEDMTSQIATLQAALTNAAKDASDAISKATAAEVAAKAAGDTAAEAKAAADKAAAEAKAAAIEAAKAEVAATKADLEKLVADGLAESKAEMEKMAQKLAEATKKVEDIVGKIADMVTSVELITKTGAINGYHTITFRTIKEQDNVFGKGLPGEMTFVKDAQVQVPATFQVRVSPTNAVLTPDMISLVNAQGENLDDFLTVVSVSKYVGGFWGTNATPQARAAAETGLWNVVVALKKYDKDSFNATVMDKINGVYKHKLFAVAVNNTSSTAETREVVSGYALQLDKVDYKPQNELNYWVDYTKNVNEIRNRYADTETGVTTGKEELSWKANAVPQTGVKRLSNGAFDPSDKYAQVAGTTAPNDNRSTVSYIYPAVQGKAFTVALDYKGNTSIDNFYAPNAAIKGMYVTLDTRNAVESSPSEINAWKSYSYTGLDQVVEGTSVDIVINGENIINDIIGLRVYAVNHDGTLVDPDGRAFYVRLGAAAANWNATATVITPNVNDNDNVTDESSANVAVSLTKLTGANTAYWTTDKVNGMDPAFNVYFVDANGTPICNTTNNRTLNTIPADFSKVAKIYTKPTVNNWTKYEDNKVYNGTLTIKNANDFVLATLEVSMQKVLPTTMPAEFSIKTAQVKDGIYNCYMVPQNANGQESWAATTATQGSMKMTEVFNFGKGVEDQYEISFATSKKDNNKDVTATVGGNEYLKVANSYINNSTKHETVIVYK